MLTIENMVYRYEVNPNVFKTTADAYYRMLNLNAIIDVMLSFDALTAKEIADILNKKQIPFKYWGYGHFKKRENIRTISWNSHIVAGLLNTLDKAGFIEHGKPIQIVSEKTVEIDGRLYRPIYEIKTYALKHLID